MKKIVITVLACLIAVSASAQKMGVVAGINTSNTSLKNFETSSVSQYHVGVAMNLPLAMGFALQPEVLYSVKGTSLDQLSSLSSISAAAVDYKAGYLEAAAQLQWGLDLSVGRAYVFGEPFVGYAVNNTFNNSVVGDVTNKWNYLNRLEYGAGIGFGVEVLKFLQVSAKYYWNLGSLYDENGSVSGALTDVKDVLASGVSQLFKDGNSYNGLQLSVAVFF